MFERWWRGRNAAANNVVPSEPGRELITEAQAKEIAGIQISKKAVKFFGKWYVHVKFQIGKNSQVHRTWGSVRKTRAGTGYAAVHVKTKTTDWHLYVIL
jgi:hypothetical protein